MLFRSNIQAVGRVATTVIQALGREQAEQILAERARSDVSGQSDLLLAQVRLSGGDREQAVQSLENLRMRLGADNPLMPQLLRLLASAHYQAGAYEKSRDAYNALLEINPNDMTALNNLAYMLAEDMDQPEQALPLAQQAVELAPRDEQVRANVYDTLGWIQHLTGNHEEAEIALRRSIRFASLPANHLHLADVLKARGLTIQAMEELNLAQQLAEENNDEATLEQIRERMKMLSSGG